ncbi:uncharacterized protein B0J16DRAFT_315442 [Fusarium flagelliforme]|uniref:uncharacterized protein n=1 Tax=Fusarium flagelliforme TaxID=2675880 RepID=UPI001E8D605E|nr:uncharacterized protein B0J16DRAFT_315442 [Fusarium flagelliforme]KAH7191729.1 hypothetical protein B0J16DRAFT_315442 [Fusarium flagelliforme]
MMQQFLLMLSLAHYALSFADFPNLAAVDDPTAAAESACATVVSVYNHCTKVLPSNAPTEASASCLCCDSTKNIHSEYTVCAEALVTLTGLFYAASGCDAAGDICTGGAAEATPSSSDETSPDTSAVETTSEANIQPDSTQPGTTTEPTSTSVIPTESAVQTAAAPSDKMYSMHAMSFILAFFLAYWVFGA